MTDKREEQTVLYTQSGRNRLRCSKKQFPNFTAIKEQWFISYSCYISILAQHGFWSISSSLRDPGGWDIHHLNYCSLGETTVTGCTGPFMGYFSCSDVAHIISTHIPWLKQFIRPKPYCKTKICKRKDRRQLLQSRIKLCIVGIQKAENNANGNKQIRYRYVRE